MLTFVRCFASLAFTLLMLEYRLDFLDPHKAALLRHGQFVLHLLAAPQTDG